MVIFLMCHERRPIRGISAWKARASGPVGSPEKTCPYRKPQPASKQPRIGRCSPMIDFLRLLACALTRLFRSRAWLEAEILVLRHQLNVLRRKAPKRVAFSSIDRLVFAGLYRLAPGVLDALKILKPETVIRWHRVGFRAYWRWKSRARGGRPKTPLEVRQLIRDTPCHLAPPQLGFSAILSGARQRPCLRDNAN